MIHNIPFSFIGSLSGGLSVALGAFAAHGLKKHLTPENLAIFEVGVRYQMYHSIALIFLGLLAHFSYDARLNWAGGAFCLGIVLFSGSLYLLSLSGQKGWGAITPIGGVFFLVGWSLLAWICINKNM